LLVQEEDEGEDDEMKSMQPMNLISTYLLFSIPAVSLLFFSAAARAENVGWGAGREETEEFPSRSTVSSDYLFFFFFFFFFFLL